MLSVLRKHAYSWTIRVMLGAIVLVFIFWGIGTGFFAQVRPVASVNGEKILPNQVAQGISEARRQIQGTYGPEAADQILKQVNLGEIVLSQLINQSLILQEAQHLKLRVSDAALEQVIAEKPVFQRDGAFDRALYEDVLRFNNLTPAQFEESLRVELTADLLKAMVTRAVYVSEAEARRQFELRHQRVALNYIELPYTDFVAQIHPTQKQLGDYYKQHAEDFREPERVKIRYIYYDPQRLAQDYHPTSSEIEKYYQANLKREFTHPEAVRVRHIFLSASDDPVARAETQARAYALVEKLKRGADFAAMARQYSTDSATRMNGGELGFVERGHLVQAFEDAVFKLKPGEISGVIETPSGFDIAQVEEIRPAHSDPLDAVRDKVIEALRLKYGNQLAQRYRQEDLRSALNGRSLSEIAKQRGLELEEPDFFAVGERVSGIGTDVNFEREVFKLAKGKVALVRDNNGTPYLVEVVDKKASYIPQFKEIEQRVRDALIRSMAEEAARRRAKELLGQIKTPAMMEAVATSAGLKVKSTGEFDRSGRQVPGIGVFPELNEAIATQAEVPGVIQRVLEHDGDSYIFALTERKPPSEEQWMASKEEFISQLRQAYQEAAWSAFVNGLKRRAHIEVDTASLAGLSGGV